MSHTNDYTNIQHLIGHYSSLIALIGFGSLVHAIVQFNNAKLNGKEFRRVDFIISIILAIFSGIMFSLSAAYFTESQLAIWWLGAMGAFGGLRFLNRLTDVVIEHLTNQARK